MRASGSTDAVLSREELAALLEEMPKVIAEHERELESGRTRVAEIELQRANEEFAIEQGLVFSNRHQRVIGISLIGQREIFMPELAELMLPTDVVARFRLRPGGYEGHLLLSRPFFFQLLSMNFGAGPTLKATRPPMREYSRIERRFYARAAREMLEQVQAAWSRLAPVQVEFEGLSSRASVSESTAGHAVLATFDVRGFGESCRVRLAISSSAFAAKEGAAMKLPAGARSGDGPSLMNVPIELRARVGTARIALSEIGNLAPGSILPLDAPSDGSLVIRIGDEDKFKAIAGSQGSKRAVQLTERIDRAE